MYKEFTFIPKYIFNQKEDLYEVWMYSTYTGDRQDLLTSFNTALECQQYIENWYLERE